MDDIPFGISRLDSLLDGGAPPGSVVLLSGEAGAGAREFAYTSAAMNALARTDDELFDLHYGELPEGAVLPPEVHYLSFTASKPMLEQELRYTLSDDIVDAVIDDISGSVGRILPVEPHPPRLVSGPDDQAVGSQRRRQP